MKHVRVFLFIILQLTIIKCLVTERSKIDIDTTQLPIKDVDKVLFKDIIEKKHEDKNLEKYDDGVYLDDVLFALKNQQWSRDEKSCIDDIYRLLYGLQNFTLWAVWEWDSLASEPQGLLFGNRYQLGNFDQCMNAPWSETHPELRTKYCLAEIVLERTDKAVRRRAEKPFDPYKSALDFIQYRPLHFRPLNDLIWGACVPSTCAPRTVERLLGVMLARSHLGVAGMRATITVDKTCQTINERNHDELFYAFFIVMGVLALICLVCTFLNCRKIGQFHTRSTCDGVIKAFCIRKNALDLLKMKKEGIEILYGIRYLTMCLIALDHTIAIHNSGPISDGLTIDQDSQSPIGLLVLHDDLFVDTFFLLSGFLTIINFMKFEKMPNLFILILKRYVRLIIALAIMVFYVSAVYPYTGSGPLWNRAVAQDTEQCRKNWWLNLLLVHNYVDTKNICIVTSWYIPCDFHFFVVTALVFWLYKQSPRLGVATAAILSIIAVVLPGVITYVNQLSAVHLFTYDFITNPRGPQDFHIAYIKSHMRYAAYLVGCYSGYLFVKISAGGNMKIIKPKWSILGTGFSIIVMLVVMVYGATFLWRSYSPVEGALYAALNRPVWAAGMALLVFCCSLGHVPLVKSFLCWFPWVPLSRLTYGLYVTHAMIITRNVFSRRNPQHNDYFEILNSAAGVIVCGTMAALVIWLIAEAPITKLLSLCLNPKVLHKKAEDEESKYNKTTNTKETTIPSTSTKYFNDNLPSNIEFSSKV